VTEALRAIADSVAKVAQELDVAGPLRILVLFDPDAIICNALRSAGAQVDCCPDLQIGRSGTAEHVGVSFATTERLMADDRHWDIVVGQQGLGRYLAVHSDPQVDQLMTWVRHHATVGLFTCPRQPLAPDLNSNGPYRTQELFGQFLYVGELDSCDRSEGMHRDPVLAVSDHYLISRSVLASASRLGPDVGYDSDERCDKFRDRRVRTFLSSDGLIVKVEIASQDYFERSQVAGEVTFLEGASPALRRHLSLPSVMSVDRGVSVVSMVRESIPGVPLDLVSDNAPGLLVREILLEATRFAECGVFPNDLRPWNILWSDGRCRFVDFADTSYADEDVSGLPQVMALVGTMVLVRESDFNNRQMFAERVTQWMRACTSAPVDPWRDSWLNIPRFAHDCSIDISLRGAKLFNSLLRQLVGQSPDTGVSP
jgi:hypothetical protein